MGGSHNSITVQIQYLGIWVIRIVEKIKLLMLPSNRLLMTPRLATVGRAYPRKHIRGNARYLVTWNVKQFAVVYFSILDKSERHVASPKVGSMPRHTD
jgi:hypothetical protein